MIGPGLAGSFLSAQMALIDEIARNIGGDPLPPADSGAPQQAQQTQQVQQLGAAPEAIPASAPGEAAATPDGEALLSERAASRPAITSTADLLAGLRQPGATQSPGAEYRGAMPQPAAALPTTMAPPTTATASTAPVNSPQVGAGEAGAAQATSSGLLPGSAAPGAELAPALAQLAPAMNDAPDRAAGASRQLPSGQAESQPGRARGSDSEDMPAGRADAAPRANVTRPMHETPAAAAARAAIAVDHSTPDDAIERARVALGLAAGSENASAMNAEPGGILSSFILNAHFQPGWPPLRPIQDADAKAFVRQLASDGELGKDDIAMLVYLANFGLKKKQLSRLLKAVAAAGNRSKLLDSLGSFLSSIGVVLNALEEELALLADELEARRERSGKRERLELR